MCFRELTRCSQCPIRRHFSVVGETVAFTPLRKRRCFIIWSLCCGDWSSIAYSCACFCCSEEWLLSRLSPMTFAGTKYTLLGSYQFLPRPDREPGRVCFSMHTWIVSCAVVIRVENPQAIHTHPVLIYIVDIRSVQPCLSVCSFSRFFICSSSPVRILFYTRKRQGVGDKRDIYYYHYISGLFATGKTAYGFFNSRGQKPCIACHIPSFLFTFPFLAFDG